MQIAFLTGSPADWVIILVVALVVFGPNKMPEVGRQLGQALREFRKIADEFTGAAHSVRDEVESAYKPVLNPPHATTSTTSATVEAVVERKPYDQEPEDLMAPVVPTPAPPAPAETADEDVKGH